MYHSGVSCYFLFILRNVCMSSLNLSVMRPLFFYSIMCTYILMLVRWDLIDFLEKRIFSAFSVRIVLAWIFKTEKNGKECGKFAWFRQTYIPMRCQIICFHWFAFFPKRLPPSTIQIIINLDPESGERERKRAKRLWRF